MDAPIYKKLNDMMENPYFSKEGQLPVSLAENFWVRLNREGRMWSAYYDGRNVSNTLTSILNAVPSPGCRIYISTVMISCTVDAYFYIQGQPGINGATSPQNTVVNCIYAKAGMPIVVKFDGDLWVETGIVLNCVTANTGETGKAYGSASGVEVQIND